MGKKNLIILISFIIILLVGSIISVFLLREWKSSIKQKENKEISAQRQSCLNKNKQADFTIKRLGKYPSPEYDRGFIEVVIKDINTDEEVAKLKIDNIISPSHYHPIELHKCGIYVIRVFNYDPEKTKQDSGYKNELWKYDYTGKGESFILLAEKPKEFISYFSPDFRVNSTESYIVLEKGYLGKDDYSLIIKDLKTKEDIFILLSKDLQKINSNFIGVFDMLKWSVDGKYFWGSMSEGAYVNGYFRIDTQNWKTDIFEAPDGAMGGSPFNINTGYVPIQPGQVWTGDYQLTQELKEQYRKEGRKSVIYLYNLFTKEKILIETTNEPLYWFKPRWLSDTELEYELPTGEKKIYKINQ